MRLSHLPLRMELLALGEVLGWPRMPGLRAGQGNWERLSRQPIQRVMPVLRAAKVRRDNLAGAKEGELTRIVTFDDFVKYEAPPIAVDEKRQRMLDTLAKARAARWAKKEAGLAN